MEENAEKILYMCTCCEKDPEKAHIPFVLATAALATDIKATIALQGDAVHIATKGYAETVPSGGGFPPMKELLDNFLAFGGELGVCGPCIKHRNIPESDLIEEAEITTAGQVNLAALDADAVFVF